MSELSPEAKRLMQVAREAYSPSAERAAAVRAALAARLDGVPGSSAPNASSAAFRSLVRGSRGLSVGVIAIGFGAGAALFAARDTASVTQRETTTRVQPASEQAVVAADSSPPSHAARRIAPATLRIATPATATGQRAQPSAASRQRWRASTRTRTANIERRANLDRVAATTRAASTERAERAAAAPVEPARTNDARHAAPQPQAREAASRAPLPAADRNDVPLSAKQAAQAPASEHSTGLVRATEPSTNANAPPTPPEPTQTPPAIDDELARELAFVRRANAALARQDGRAALSIVAEHERAFPHGRLVQERVALRALALCALGENADAQAAVAKLQRIAPRSPHLMRIRAACEPFAPTAPAR